MSWRSDDDEPVTGRTSCMGGGCILRDDCTRHNASDRSDPRERICDRGRDGFAGHVQIVIVRASGSWRLTPADRAAIRARTGLV